jgi:hypothetical protein
MGGNRKERGEVSKLPLEESTLAQLPVSSHLFLGLHLDSFWILHPNHL